MVKIAKEKQKLDLIRFLYLWHQNRNFLKTNKNLKEDYYQLL